LHESVWRSGSGRTRWGSLQRSPGPLARLREGIRGRKLKGGRKREGKEMKEGKRRRKGKERRTFRYAHAV